MNYELIECSPKAKRRIVSFNDAIGVDSEHSHPLQKFPWPSMKIGQSFTVPFIEANEASLRNGASQFSKRTGKKLVVIRHAEYGCFEVARIA